MPRKRHRISIRISAAAVIAVLTALLGFAIVVQVRQNSSTDNLANLREDDLVGILDNQNARAQRLRQQIAELEQTLQPVRGAVAREMRVALPRERDRMRQRIADGERAEFVAESIDRFDDAVRARQSLDASLPPLDSDDAARLIVALDDVFVRDRVLTWAEGGRAGALRVLLDELVPRAMSGYEAPVLTVHALAAYAAGEGALAGIAVERARKAAPDYNLARLVDEALLRCVNPAIIREWLRLFNADLWVSDNQ